MKYICLVPCHKIGKGDIIEIMPERHKGRVDLLSEDGVYIYTMDKSFISHRFISVIRNRDKLIDEILSDG